MNFTDTLLLTTLTFLIATGAYQGLLRSLIGPGCFLIAIILASTWYTITRDLLITVIIIITSPIILNWLTHLVLEIRSQKNPPRDLSLTSRLSGAAIHALWGILLGLAFMTTAIVLPLSKFYLGDITNNVLASKTYGLLQRSFSNIGIIAPSKAEECLANACSMAKRSGKIINDDNIQNLINAPEFQALLSDPVIKTALEKRDIQTLLSNPAIIKLRKNPAFINKLLQAYPKVRTSLSL